MAEVGRPYGLLAEFERAETLMEAARAIRRAGYERFEAYTPFPVEGMGDALDFRDSRVPGLAFLGGAVGGGGMLFLQWYANAVDYPLNIGGRALESWPAFAVPAFATAMLAATLVGFVAMLWLNGLPRLNHPVFNVPRFECASRNRFFLCVETRDPLFHRRDTTDLLRALGATRVEEVPG